MVKIICTRAESEYDLANSMNLSLLTLKVSGVKQICKKVAARKNIKSKSEKLLYSQVEFQPEGVWVEVPK